MQEVQLAGMVGPYQLLIILAIVVLLFGAKKIPELARGLGEGIRNFREGIKNDDDAKDGDPDKLPEDSGKR